MTEYRRDDLTCKALLSNFALRYVVSWDGFLLFVRGKRDCVEVDAEFSLVR